MQIEKCSSPIGDGNVKGNCQAVCLAVLRNVAPR